MFATIVRGHGDTTTPQHNTTPTHYSGRRVFVRVCVVGVWWKGGGVPTTIMSFVLQCSLQRRRALVLWHRGPSSTRQRGFLLSCDAATTSSLLTICFSMLLSRCSGKESVTMKNRLDGGIRWTPTNSCTKPQSYLFLHAPMSPCVRTKSGQTSRLNPASIARVSELISRWCSRVSRSLRIRFACASRLTTSTTKLERQLAAAVLTRTGSVRPKRESDGLKGLRKSTRVQMRYFNFFLMQVLDSRRGFHSLRCLGPSENNNLWLTGMWPGVGCVGLPSRTRGALRSCTSICSASDTLPNSSSAFLDLKKMMQLTGMGDAVASPNATRVRRSSCWAPFEDDPGRVCRKLFLSPLRRIVLKGHAFAVPPAASVLVVVSVVSAVSAVSADSRALAATSSCSGSMVSQCSVGDHKACKSQPRQSPPCVG